MLVNIFVWLALFALAVVFGWLVTRAWRSRRALVRWPGVIFGGLLTLLLVILLGMGAVGWLRTYLPASTPAPELTIEYTPERVERGRHLAAAFCAGCHSTNSDFPLTGGMDLANDIPIPIGSFVSSNLTPAGPLPNYTDGELLRLFRHGLDKNGRNLFAMSGANVRYMSDEDLYSMIAFLRSQAPAGEMGQQPPDRMNFLGLLMVGSGMIKPLPPAPAAITAPPRGATVEYGQYVLSYQDCNICHGADFNGGDGQLAPAGPGLRVVRRMDQDQFVAMMRTGMTPEGRQLQPPMPWQAIGRLDEDELAAMYMYLVSLP